MMNLHDNPYTDGYFERAEGSNYRNYGDDPGWEVTANIVRGFLPEVEHPQLLEMGSAKGYFLAAAQHHGFDVTGIDISEHAVAATPAMVKPYNRHGDVRDLLEIFKYESKEFDVVCSWEFFEHIYLEDISSVLHNSFALVEPGGLYVHRIALTDGGMEEDHDSTHVSMFDRETWETSFDHLGLIHEPELEERLRSAFQGRDWEKRFFVWRRV